MRKAEEGEWEFCMGRVMLYHSPWGKFSFSKLYQILWNLDFRHNDDYDGDDNDGANDEWEEKASGFGRY
ncbi:hypothetical protein Glove_60g83 [Diversispora epigaea]|uniref:Uncharacterized protein n=1 Tax=Diversispora epigaea TaxID=1348612 RepID=A0A397JBV5_9GLOM|nr:hypothetical protein Glove_60g83 [Diversispora epigaea]